MSSFFRFLELDPEEQYASLVFVENEDLLASYELGGGEPWGGGAVELAMSGNGHARLGSLPWVGSHVLTMRDEAVDALQPLLKSHGFFGGLDYPDTRLVMFGAPKIPGALDESRSDVFRGPSGALLVVRRPVFNLDAVGDRVAFQLAEQRRSRLYLREDFVDRICAVSDTSGTAFRRPSIAE